MSKLIALDIECVPNYFLLSVKGVESGKVLNFEAYGEKASLSKGDITKIKTILKSRISFGFNSNKYDMPLIAYALTCARCDQLYKVSVAIIEHNVPAWMTMKKLDIEYPTMNHFDISEPAPAVMISLKNYGTRIGSKKLMEFFVDPHLPISPEDVVIMRDIYCKNDLDVTIDLYKAIKDRIDLRIAMSKEYGMDLRSKSDAQIAETVIISELEKLGVSNIVKPELMSSHHSVRYSPPEYISFKSRELNILLETVKTITFSISENGQIKMPPILSNHKLAIGNTVYKMGIGGLHSQEKSIAITSNETHVMRNADFASYYPFIILNQELYPNHLTRKFLDVYRKIVMRRLEAKRIGNKLLADSLKITINGSFGKFGSKYSKLYSPDLLLATTITGQLTLLMLIEQFEDNGISVISANTDGLEYFCPRDKIDLAETIIFDLELITGYEMEHGSYQGLYARDVNNYVAKYDGYVKAKGIYGETTLSKGLQTPIVFEAIRKYILDGTSIEKTINECTIVNSFLSARTVKGGAVWKGEYLGKMVRWYYSTDGEKITYKTNGNLVPKTGLGVTPMMDISTRLPSNLNYRWYIDEAIDMLKDLGVNNDE